MGIQNRMTFSKKWDLGEASEGGGMILDRGWEGARSQQDVCQGVWRARQGLSVYYDVSGSRCF